MTRNRHHNAVEIAARVRRLAGAALAISALASPVSAWADAGSSPFIAYGESAAAAPRYRVWNRSNWGAEQSANSIGGTVAWVAVRNSPLAAASAMLTLDANDDLWLQTYAGAWSAATLLCSDTGTDDSRGFDLAYESASGDLLLAWWDATKGKIGYRTMPSGGVLSGESQLTLSSTSTVHWLKLVVRPNSNEVMLLAVNTSKALYAAAWNGTAFGSVITLNSALNTASQEAFDAAFESVSGDLLVVYGLSSATPKYRTWSGGVWSSELSVPSVGDEPLWIRLAADPAGNAVLFACADADQDLNVNVWSGTAWGSNQELERKLTWSATRPFDVAYEPDGSEALIVYVEKSHARPRYRTWNGANWSGEAWGPSLGDTPVLVQLRPAVSGGEIFIAALDSNADLNALRWTGSSMTAAAELESTSSSANKECFMISPPAPSALTPAPIPYANDFESDLGEEWSIPTRTASATCTTFAGRYANHTLKLALQTTVGETYAVAFDLYTLDSWDGSDFSDGPDYFNVSVNGTQLLHHTFGHDSWYDTFWTYPIPCDLKGAFGFEAEADAAYRCVQTVFTATSTVSYLAFTGETNDESGGGLSNESWGIDNISVRPATFIDVSTAKRANVSTCLLSYSYGGGVHAGDFDDDGDQDLLFTGNAAKLLKNADAGYGFTSTSLGDRRRQAAVLDIDNDGDHDLWVPAAGNEDTEKCMRNDGAASFSDAGALGFSNPSNNEGAAAADIDLDGWCDVLMFSGDGSYSNWIGVHQGDPGAGLPALAGDNSLATGLNDGGDYGNGDFCSAADVNNDNRLDFFYHYGTGKLFVSDGDGSFTENPRGISVTVNDLAKIGSAWADYDNDGDVDLYVARVGGGYNGYLWRNDVNWTGPSGAFTDVSSSSGLKLGGGVSYEILHLGPRSACWGDYDNDGDLDLFMVGANGGHMLYRNNADGSFTRVGVGIPCTGYGIDAVFFDYDNDGDLDLAMSRDLWTTTVLFENRTNNTNYLLVRAIGAGSGRTNRAGVGLRVELWNAAGTTRLARRDLGVARGFGGTEPLWAHFGGVTNTSTYTLKVYFHGSDPSSPKTLTVVPANESTTIDGRVIPQMVTVSEASGVRVIRWREKPNPDPS